MSKRLMRVQGLWAKTEATEGTDPTPVATNAVRLAEPALLELGAEIENLQDDVVMEVLGKASPLSPAAKWAQLTVGWQIRGAGSAYSGSNLPEVDALLQACALSQTVVTTTTTESVTYELMTSSQKSATLYLMTDGKRSKMLGARGNLVIVKEAGQPGRINFTMRGIYDAVTDTAFATGTYGSTVPPLFKGASSLVYNAVSSLIARRFEARLGNVTTPRLNANAADALAGYHITDRTAEAEFTVEDPLVATAAFEADWAAGTSRVLDTQLGSTQYNRFKVHLDRFTPRPPSFLNDNGLVLTRVAGRVGIEGTEDFSLIFD